MCGLQVAGQCESGAFAIGYGVYHFAATVDAVAAGKIFGIGGLAGGALDLDATVFDDYAAAEF